MKTRINLLELLDKPLELILVGFNQSLDIIQMEITESQELIGNN
jgi:hypothetical protein